jgi:hypothetical protein
MQDYPPTPLALPPAGCTSQSAIKLIESLNEAAATVPDWNEHTQQAKEKAAAAAKAAAGEGKAVGATGATADGSIAPAAASDVDTSAAGVATATTTEAEADAEADPEAVGDAEAEADADEDSGAEAAKRKGAKKEAKLAKKAAEAAAKLVDDVDETAETLDAGSDESHAPATADAELKGDDDLAPGFQVGGESVEAAGAVVEGRAEDPDEGVAEAATEQ